MSERIKLVFVDDKCIINEITKKNNVNCSHYCHFDNGEIILLTKKNILTRFI